MKIISRITKEKRYQHSGLYKDTTSCSCSLSSFTCFVKLEREEEQLDVQSEEEKNLRLSGDKNALDKYVEENFEVGEKQKQEKEGAGPE